ncbi:MAG TPA: acyl-CoA dehydrogenase family protein, partial [Syntrophorhabdaceae bacterium]|nr:acyl-CoA dehydrogenase family protein [Syntrophorhabdaceae bacterium]
GLFENVLVCEELCRGDSSMGVCLSLADFASDILLLFGTDQQKSRWLPKVARGEALSCGAFTEPDHGSDIKTVDTIAFRDDNQWVINGSKLFISNGGPRAGFYLVLCRTDPECSISYRGPEPDPCRSRPYWCLGDGCGAEDGDRPLLHGRTCI